MPSPAQVPLFRRLLGQCGVIDPVEVGLWLDALNRVRSTSDGRTARPPAPYRGLEPFQPQDADFFFGREQLTGELVTRLAALRDEPAASRGILALTGPSGSGKSSLLRAGLVPALRAAALGHEWDCVVVTPGSAPLEAFRQGQAALTGNRHVIVVDQFEEVFVSVADDERRALLEALAALDPADTLVVLGIRADFYAQAAREPELVPVLQHAQVLMGPMSEAEVRSAIVEPARRAGISVDDGFADVVVADMARRGLPGYSQDAGALPLLSHALLATWDRATRNHLTIADYHATGGINGAIRQTADELFAQLNPDEQLLARRIFLRLVNVDEEMQATRRRVRHDELDELSAHLGDEVHHGEVLQRYVDKRLITLDADTVEVSHEALLTAWPRLRDWIDADLADLRVHRRLTESANAWQQAGRDEALLLRGGRLVAAADWAEAQAHRAALNRTEADFLDASGAAAAAERDTARRRARRLQTLVAALAALVVVAGTLTVYAFTSRAEANRARATAEVARDEALSRQVAIESVRLRDTDPALATQLALVAYRISRTTDARSVLLDTSAQRSVTRVLGPSGPTALALSGDGRFVAVGHADDGSARLYRLTAGAPPSLLAAIPGAGGDAQLFALAFSPDGRTLATGNAKGVVRLWDITTPNSPHPRGAALAPAFGNAVQGLTFSPDGHSLVASGTGPALQRWDVTDAARPRPAAAPASVAKSLTMQSVAFSADGRLLAAGGADGTVLLWTSAATRPPVTLSFGTSTVNVVTFDPQSKLLAAGTKDGVVRLWDVSTPARPKVVPGPTTGFTSWVSALAFSPDGTGLAAGSSDNTLATWDAHTWTRTAKVANPGPVTGARYTPDGTRLLSTAADGALRVWQVGGPAVPVAGPVFGLVFDGDGERLAVGTTAKAGRGGTASVWDVTNRVAPRQLGSQIVPPAPFGTIDGTAAITSDGKTLIVGNSSGGVQLMDVSDPAHPAPLGAPLPGPKALIEAIAFSPNQKLAAAGSDDNAVHLWDVSDPLHPKSYAPLPVKSLALGVIFSPDSNLLVGTVADNTTHLWDVSDPAHPLELAVLSAFKNYAWAPAFSPDGRTLAVTSADHTTRLWDVTDPSKPVALGGPLTGPSDYAESASFTPDGTTLAVGSGDHTVWLYDIHDRTHPAVLATLRALDGSVYSLTYSPDGRTLVGAGGDSAARLWDVDPDRVAQSICRTAGDRITAAEWSQYVPGKAYAPPCP